MTEGEKTEWPWGNESQGHSEDNKRLLKSNMSAPAATRQEWAIARGQEHAASAHQQAVLVYVAFRAGEKNRCYWPLDKIAEQTRMHRNTISRCLRWWVEKGVLKGTAQLRGPTIYELAQYHSGGDAISLPR